MHLVLIIHSLNPGGAERVLSRLATHWATQGHQVTLLTIAPLPEPLFYPLDPRIHLKSFNHSSSSASSAPASFSQRLESFARRRNWLRSTLRALGFGKVAAFITFVRCMPWIRHTLRTLQPDKVISFIELTNLMTLIAAWGLKIPIIASERTHPAYYTLPKVVHMLRRWLYPKAFKVVMQTASAARYFKTLDNIAIIPNPVPCPPRQKEGLATPVQRIVSIGRLCPFKGFDTLIHAFAKLTATFPHLQLTIYGQGPARPALEHLIATLGLCDRISLPGVTPHVYEALYNTDLFVFPSQYEGFPNALCEAMAVGLPVIASACSGNIDIIRDGLDGRLFPVGDSHTLAALMRQLIENETERTQLAHQARTVCTRFHPDHIFHLWDALLDSSA